MTVLSPTAKAFLVSLEKEFEDQEDPQLARSAGSTAATTPYGESLPQ